MHRRPHTKPQWLSETPAHWSRGLPCLRRRRRLRLCRGLGEVYLLAAACPCRGAPPGRDASCRIPRRLLGLSPCRAVRTRPSAARRVARPACNSGGRGPWCGGSCSTSCRYRPAYRQPPAWAFLAAPSLPDFSTTSTSWFFFFLPFRRRPFLAGAVPSLSDSPSPTLSPGSFLPSSACAHLSARA